MNWLEQFESFVNQASNWIASALPASPTPSQTALFTSGSFLAIVLVIFLIGRILMGFRRNNTTEARGSRRRLIFGPLTEAFAWMIPVSQRAVKKLRQDLLKAGYHHRKSLEEYLAFRNAALLSWLIFIGVTVVALASPDENITPKILIAGLAVVVLIYGIPRVVLSAQAHSRAERIQFSLPDALDLINMTVTGGLPLRQAISRVGKELKTTHPDVACELAIVDMHAETGSLEQALKQFAARIDLPDVTALAAIVRQAERLGGAVATAFQDFADGIRLTRRQTAEERGNKASVKLLFPIVFCLAPPIYVLLLGPAVIELKRFVQRESQAGGALTQSPANPLGTADASRPSSVILGD
ncbi:MAG: tight adherence protein C [Pirellulaceae bacterium]|jgi:tight adherence protein C